MATNAWGGYIPDNVPLDVLVREEKAGRTEENNDNFLNPLTSKLLPANIESLVEQQEFSKKTKRTRKSKDKEIEDSGDGIEGSEND